MTRAEATDQRTDAVQVAGGSMVARAVRQLTDMSLAAKDGDYLGAEGDLLKALGVSRPTLRQAAKVVENDRLLAVRRGVNGGFFAQRPDARQAIQGPALWLRLQAATLDQTNRAGSLIFPAAAADAARCIDPTLIAELHQFAGGIDARLSDDENPRETVRAETRLADLIARMTGDPVMLLFISISYSFGLFERDVVFDRASPERRQRWLALQRDLCAAILARDADLARTIARERGDTIARWIRDDRRKSDSPDAH